MITLMLTRGVNAGCIPLDLPATPAEIREAYAMLDAIIPDGGQTRISSANTGVGALDRYLRDRPVDRPGDYIKLGELAEKIAQMDNKAIKTFDGALTGSAFNSVADILRIADSLEDYIFIHGVTTEKELGRFLVDSGYKSFPEEVKPYLDYAAIGIEYHAEHDGAFTGDGYTLRRDSAEHQNDPVFHIHIWTEAMRQEGQEPMSLTLPATAEQLLRVRESVGARELSDAMIVQMEYNQAYLKEYLPLDHPDLGQLNQVAEMLTEAWSGEEPFKLMAVLAAERPETLDAVIKLLGALDDYKIVLGGVEEYGKDSLYELCGDEDIVSVIDGFIDWKEFGQHMMEEDGISLTEFGAVKKTDSQRPGMEPEMRMGGL